MPFGDGYCQERLHRGGDVSAKCSVMDRCTFGRKDRERLFQALEVKEAVKERAKGKYIIFREARIFSVAGTQGTVAKHRDRRGGELPRGFVSHACLDLAVINHDKCYTEGEAIVLCFRKIMLVKSAGDG